MIINSQVPIQAKLLNLIQDLDQIGLNEFLLNEGGSNFIEEATAEKISISGRNFFFCYAHLLAPSWRRRRRDVRRGRVMASFVLGK